MTTMSDAN